MIDKQVPHKDEDAVLHLCSQRRKREATAAFLRSFKEGLIGNLEHLGRGCTWDNQAAPGESEGERERHTQTLRHVTGVTYCNPASMSIGAAL